MNTFQVCVCVGFTASSMVHWHLVLAAVMVTVSLASALPTRPKRQAGKCHNIYLVPYIHSYVALVDHGFITCVVSQQISNQMDLFFA